MEAGEAEAPAELSLGSTKSVPIQFRGARPAGETDPAPANLMSVPVIEVSTNTPPSVTSSSVQTSLSPSVAGRVFDHRADAPRAAPLSPGSPRVAQNLASDIGIGRRRCRCCDLVVDGDGTDGTVVCRWDHRMLPAPLNARVTTIELEVAHPSSFHSHKHPLIRI